MDKNKREQGVLTVEACISFTIYMMVILTILFLMRIVYVYGLIHHATAQTAKELATYTYLYHVSGIGDLKNEMQGGTQEGTDRFNADAGKVVEAYEALAAYDLDGAVGSLDGVTTDPKKILQEVASALVFEGTKDLNNMAFEALARAMMAGYIDADSGGSGADQKLKNLQVTGGLASLDLSGSHFFEKGNTIDIVVCYKMEPILPIDLLPELNLMNRAMVVGLGGESAFD